MQALELHTKIDHGVIQLPRKYKDMTVDNVKIIILMNENPEVKTKSVDFFDTINADLTGFKFNREEANER